MLEQAIRLPTHTYGHAAGQLPSRPSRTRGLLDVSYVGSSTEPANRRSIQPGARSFCR
jgi:hypothetical protein